MSALTVSSARNVLTDSSFPHLGLGWVSPGKLSLMAQPEYSQLHPSHPIPAQPCFRHISHVKLLTSFLTLTITWNHLVYLLNTLYTPPPSITVRMWVLRRGRVFLTQCSQFLPKCPAYCHHSIRIYWMNVWRAANILWRLPIDLTHGPSRVSILPSPTM